MEGALADKYHNLMLDALTRAAAEPAGLPLLGSKSVAGLFAASAAGKQAAETTKAEGLVRVVRAEKNGKSTQEICVITEKGLGLLLQQANPRLVLEAFVGALDARRQQLDALLESVQAGQEHLASLRSFAEKVLVQLQQPQPLVISATAKNGKPEADEAAAALAHLTRRQAARTLDDCPLPELHRHLQSSHPALTLGQFHDVLRRLHETGRIYLHPWTGPLYELPEPACALLVGHEVAFYASARL